MEIAEALRATIEEQDLSPEHLAVAAKVTGAGARNWIATEKPMTPSGDVLLRLMKAYPSFAKRLGFGLIRDDAAAA